MNSFSQTCRGLISVAALGAAVAVGCASRKTLPATLPALAMTPAAAQPIDPIIAAIREEGFNHSSVEFMADQLCNHIGPRLTGSQNLLYANQWARNELSRDGLANAHLEPWGPFGRGWSLDSFSLRVTSPQPIELQSYPKAWTPGFDSTVQGPLVYFDAKTTNDFAKYHGKLKDQIVLIGKPRVTPAEFDPPGTRMDATLLKALAAAKPGVSVVAVRNSLTSKPATAPVGEAAGDGKPTAGELLADLPAKHLPAGPRPTTRSLLGPTEPPSAAAALAAQKFADREFAFAVAEGAKLVLTPSTGGDGGTIFVAGAATPTTEATTQLSGLIPPTTLPATQPKPWDVPPPLIPAQIMLSTESFNRLVRLIADGESIAIACDLHVTFRAGGDKSNYNTLAEIPGSDLKDQIVMIGAHLDSWHSGTGATDNAAGVVTVMEAARILKKLDLHPRRTIRIALWTGEEEGLLGSTAYVKDHFGYLPATTEPSTMPANTASTRSFLLPESEKLAAYYNLDNGTGKIRGIFAQSNEAAYPLFKQWIAPFADLGCATVSLANTGSTDHISFDRIGLPGFQFIQDPIEYFSRTHHSNADTFERLQMDDLKEAATVMAAFVWHTANMDERFPRKPMP